MASMQINSCPACSSPRIHHMCTVQDRIVPNPLEYWQIYCCRVCGFGWTSPQPSADDLPKYYPTTYHGDTRKTLDEYLSGSLTRSRSWRGEREKVELVEQYVDGGKILDVGCGEGRFLWAMDPERWTRTGVDFAAATIREIRARIPSLRMIVGDLASESLAGELFDVITFWHALEHMPDTAGCLNRARELLRPGGLVFISLPNLDSLQAGLFKEHWYCFDDVPRHLYHFSRRSLDLFLSRAGLKVIRHMFFSRRVSFHSLKHSLLQWSTQACHSRAPYYLIKPLLTVFPLVEHLTGKYGIITTIAGKFPR